MLNTFKNESRSGAFRDIRPDLRERLRLANAELEHVRLIIGELEKAVQVLEQMLAAEEQRFNPEPSQEEKQPEGSLGDFLLKSMMRSSAQGCTKEDLRWMAERAGYSIDGRSIHATLVNLIKAGKAVEIGEGHYGTRTQG